MNAVLKPSIEMAEEHYSEKLCEEILPLLVRNWHESESYKPNIELKPNFSGYKKLDELGMLLPYIARVDGQIVGYAIWMIVSSFNYQGLKCGHGAALFLEPEYRGYGVTLLRKSEQVLRSKGITRFYWFVPPGGYLQKVLSGWGYEADEILMEKLK